MQLAAKAYRIRAAARDAFLSGDISRARELTGKAQDLSATAKGSKLNLLARWVQAGSGASGSS